MYLCSKCPRKSTKRSVVLTCQRLGCLFARSSSLQNLCNLCITRSRDLLMSSVMINSIFLHPAWHRSPWPVMNEFGRILTSSIPPLSASSSGVLSNVVRRTKNNVNPARGIREHRQSSLWWLRGLATFLLIVQVVEETRESKFLACCGMLSSVGRRKNMKKCHFC